MRRRRPALDSAHEPPARLRSFDMAEWLPLVDVSKCHEDDWRDRRNWELVGPVNFPFEARRRDQAWHLFRRARLAWHEQHGWPGGLDSIELLQETVRLRIAEFHGRVTGTGRQDDGEPAVMHLVTELLLGDDGLAMVLPAER